MIQVQTRKQKFPWLLSLSLIEAILRKSLGSNAIGKTIRKTIIITHLAKAKSAEKYPMCMAFPQALHCTLLFLINFTTKIGIIFLVNYKLKDLCSVQLIFEVLLNYRLVTYKLTNP